MSPRPTRREAALRADGWEYSAQNYDSTARDFDEGEGPLAAPFAELMRRHAAHCREMAAAYRALSRGVEVSP